MASRQKFVFSTDEIPHIWAHGSRPAGKIRNAQGNLFAEGDTLYSYGYHFPIARRVVVPGTITVGTRPSGRKRSKVRDVPGPVTLYLYTTRRYSVTTRGHCYAAQGAMRNNGQVFHIDPTDAAGRDLWKPLTTRKGSARPVAEWYQSRIDAAERSAAAPRIRSSTRIGHAERAAELLAEWRTIHAAFRLRVSVDSVKCSGSVADITAKYADAIKRERAAAKARAEREAAERAAAAARRAARAARVAENLPAVIADWRAGGTGRVEFGEGAMRDHAGIRDVPYPVLRLRTGHPATAAPDESVVETSHGARVTADEARQALRILPRLIARMDRTDERDDSISIGHYHGVNATRDALRIGCHTIPWAEVAAFCAYVGWECPTLPAPVTAAA